MTIGVDFAIKLVQIMGFKVKLQVWDTGGQERFSYIRPLYYKGAMAALAIFDLTNRESYENLPKWFQEVADNCGPIPLILVGNKCDLPDRAVETSEAQELSERLGIYYFEASAKDGSNINSLFMNLAEILLQKKVPAIAEAPATPVTPTTSTPEFASAPPEISHPPTVPTISPPPAVPTISAPPKPPTFTPTFPTFETPTQPEPSPSLDEALKILEGTDETKIEITPPTLEPMDITPPTPEPIDLTIPDIEPVDLTPPTPPEPIDITPPTPEPIDISPPTPEPIDITPPQPFDTTPPIPPPIDNSPPTPVVSSPPTPTAPTSFIPFTTTSSPAATTQAGPLRAVFVPFSAASSTPSTPASESTSTGSTWIDFMKTAPKVEAKKSTFIPFVSTIEEPEEIVLEVVPKVAKEPETKEITCPGCHRKISSAWKFCTYCGSNLN